MITPIDELLAQSPESHVWVLEYGISHGRRMRLAFHHGDYPRRTDVVARGCTHFRGRLEGGPYRLALEQRPRDSLDGKESPPEYRLYDQGGELELICDELVVDRVW